MKRKEQQTRMRKTLAKPTEQTGEKLTEKRIQKFRETTLGLKFTIYFLLEL